MTFQKPQLGDPLAPSYENPAMIEALRLRRSTAADFLQEPGPDDVQLQTILEIATRAPDHRRVVPFRFIVFAGDARARAGDVFSKIAIQKQGADENQQNIERGRFMRAPVIVGVVACLDEGHRTPVWEQTLTVGAVCQNMLIAAGVHGFAAQWLTEWVCFDKDVDAAFGLSDTEKLAGLMYIGSAREEPKERPRPDAQSLTSFF